MSAMHKWFAFSRQRSPRRSDTCGCLASEPPPLPRCFFWTEQQDRIQIQIHIPRSGRP